MDFIYKLYNIDGGLGEEDINALKFLCRDLLPLNKLIPVQTGQELFQLLMNNDLIKEDDDFLIAELLYIIKQHNLLKQLDTNKEIVRDAVPKQGKISIYRQMLFELSENVTDDDLKHINFLLGFHKKQKENQTFLDLLCHLEKIEYITEENVDKLEEIFKKVSPNLLGLITKYKETKAMLGSQEMSMKPSSPQDSESEVVSKLRLSIQASNTDMEPLVYGAGTESVIEHVQLICEEAEKEDDKAGNIESRITELSLDPQNMTPVYTMNRKHRGYCFIINNLYFMNSKTRDGTMKDADDLENVFTWLGLDVSIYKDQTSEEIHKRMKYYQSLDHSDRDCFVCCVLSHGESGSVMGTDNSLISIHTIMSYFTAIRCSSLAAKPKLFFIQACQGKTVQKAYPIEDDASVPIERKYVKTIPDDADFLLGMSTVDGYSSFRHVREGTWYIQALCKNLAEMVPRQEDILSILTKVNKDVSAKEDPEGKKKQMPQPAYTLLKKLIFPVPEVPFKPTIYGVASA
ncbi:caspase-8-like [Rhinophrynus dorsalis]